MTKLHSIVICFFIFTVSLVISRSSLAGKCEQFVDPLINVIEICAVPVPLQLPNEYLSTQTKIRIKEPSYSDRCITLINEINLKLNNKNTIKDNKDKNCISENISGENNELIKFAPKLEKHSISNSKKSFKIMTKNKCTGCIKKILKNLKELHKLYFLSGVGAGGLLANENNFLNILINKIDTEGICGEKVDLKNDTKLRIVAGKNLVDQSFCQAIKKGSGNENFVVITRPVNPASYAYYVFGLPTKDVHQKGKSSQKSLIKGLIPVDQRLSKCPKDEIEKYNKIIQESLDKSKDKYFGALYKVKSKSDNDKNNEEQMGIYCQINDKKDNSNFKLCLIPFNEHNQKCYDKQSLSKEIEGDCYELSEECMKKVEKKYHKTCQAIKVIADKDGNYVTADVDLLSVGVPTNDDGIEDPCIQEYTQDYGQITKKEFKLMKDVNAKYKEFVSNFTTNLQTSIGDIIRHGADSQFTKTSSRAKDLLPARVYFNHQGICRIGVIENNLNEIEQFAKRLGKENIYLKINPQWEKNSKE
ncbi:MAG: hypothetical protein HQK49_17755 [Oligoflexia bacterium]|nr:hypothetical protein [Oligoflexia bacterium]